jgi:hypothetical protein
MGLGYSLAGWIKSSRTLSKYIKPVANWYADLAGYRKMGLKYDDLRECFDALPDIDLMKRNSDGGKSSSSTGKDYSIVQ